MEQCYEQEYIKNVGICHRKKYAQFFTPQRVAELMCKWLLGADRLERVLEPAFGLGVFSRIILNKKPDVEIRGYDIDCHIMTMAQEIFGDKENVSLLLQDYMYNDWDSKYDGVICNPPYFKFHDYDNKGVLKEVERHTGCEFNGFTNLYTLFLIKSIYQLKDNGRCAYIVPSEFLNSDYGALIKRQLIKAGVLRYVFVFDFEENVFDDVLTTACILLCANDKKTDRVRFERIKSLADLPQIERITDSYPNKEENENTYSLDELNPDMKWKNYYKKQNSSRFKYLVPFSNYAKVMRGIATGDNGFFTFNASKAQYYGLDMRNFLPCVCHSVDIEGLLFTDSDYNVLKGNDKKVLLFNASADVENPNVAAYIKKGENEGVNRRHLTSHRRPWYSIENRLPAPIWVSVFNRSGLRFVRNEAGIVNLTTFHCIYPQSSSSCNVTTDLLFAYLITDTAKSIFEDNVREYGNGLMKFEPNDLNKGQMLDLQRLPDERKIQIEKIYADNKNSGSTAFIHEIDMILKEYF